MVLRVNNGRCDYIYRNGINVICIYSRKIKFIRKDNKRNDSMIEEEETNEKEKEEKKEELSKKASIRFQSMLMPDWSMIWGQSMHNEIAVGEVNTRCYASNTYVVETGSRASMFFARLNDKCRFFLSVGRQNRPWGKRNVDTGVLSSCFPMWNPSIRKR